ncbi:hypothetical protein K432DRAFT_394749 [Lepidopterella palustris CBS 459.81]|uniref:VOC domain-containing protein n=1 Tax=Lepidopterella palustris CBS 459.81 TaxID=1314670 RepID=A0A8E2E6V6_9PEZI|nr:hypothetical protein K432DRAFT_394749 [Lepidopterella palustris CBS 459.81]
MTVDFDNADTKVKSVAFLGHMVLRIGSQRYKPIVDFFVKPLEGGIPFGDNTITFVRYDYEHHRIGITNDPRKGPPSKGDPQGTEHIGFAFNTFEDLALLYRQRKAHGILPS